ncbi:hypothetical protein MPSEU_000663400 [Mayamaea pseudoterrestris]|nr:hypothetical protein MPSEU_000663400 [Mayamaea pseudoterrestris]
MKQRELSLVYESVHDILLPETLLFGQIPNTASHSQAHAKLKQLGRDSEPRLEPPHTPGAFLHVGKTGGSTVSQQLVNGCHAFVTKPCHMDVKNESYMSKLTTYIHTPDFKRLGSKPDYVFDFYVATLRDPLTRFISAFVFMHPQNKLESEQRFYRRLEDVYKCFPTIETFTEALGDYNFREMARAGNCTMLARDILSNRFRDAHHFYYDTKFILKKLPPESPLLVIRNEHLWHDWVSANQWLGQESVATFPDAAVRDYSNRTLSVSKQLSNLGRQRLCRGLEREYQAYWQLIELAVNLSPQEKIASFELARQSCPDLQSLGHAKYQALVTATV